MTQEEQPTRQTLAGKFTQFRYAMHLDEMPPEQTLFGQGCYLAGAQATFQILAAASDKTREEAIIIWAELQNEIKTAAPRPTKPLVELPPEKQVII